MNSNSTENSLSGSSDYELVIACVALAVSAIALVIALFQAFQQYYASATGYASCKEFRDWRMVQIHQPPVAAVRISFRSRFPESCYFRFSSEQQRGPLGPHLEERSPHAGKRNIMSRLKRFVESKFARDEPQEVTCHKITYLVGTEASYQKTYTWSQEKYDQRIRKLEAMETRQSIRTADNELAAWLVLLMAVQRMEKESRQWQAEKYIGYNYEWYKSAFYKPLSDNFNKTDANNLHTLTVGIQKKKKSWDTVPGNMKKPYATSTICHIVEIIAMLGIHWKVFNQNENQYRAQGNGFLVTGANVDGLGIVFSFHKTGETWFEENRIIPDENVKELCFGYCPTIFRPRKFKMYADEPKDLGTLQLSSFAAMAETLGVIGCNTKTVKYFSKPSEETRYSHLFPVAFEMLGMVGIVLQINGTAFRMLPNPSIHHWGRKSFSLRTLLVTYMSALDETAKYQKQEAQVETQNVQAMFNDNDQIRMIISEANKIEKAFSTPEQKIRDFEERRNQKQGQGGFTTYPMTEQRLEEPRLYCRALMTTLHTAIKKCDEFLQAPRETPVVQSVLRVHLQEVLGILNLRHAGHDSVGDNFEDTDANESSLKTLELSSKVPKIGREQMTHKYQKVMLRYLQRLDSASYGERHAALVDMYISSVRENVIRKICGELDREKRGQKPWNLPKRIQRTRLELLLNGDENELDVDRVGVEDCWAYVEPKEKQEINDVWMDAQIDKQGLFGSRLPVYIA